MNMAHIIEDEKAVKTNQRWKCPTCLVWVREPIGKACLTCRLAKLEIAHG
jgi:hypothetical protein